MKLSLYEKMVMDGSANLQRGRELVGGCLSLTSNRLIFESHAINIQTGPTEISLADISEVKPCWTRLFGFLPVVPNSLLVRTADGSEYRFIVFDRDHWKELIDQQRTEQTAPRRSSGNTEVLSSSVFWILAVSLGALGALAAGLYVGLELGWRIGLTSGLLAGPVIGALAATRLLKLMKVFIKPNQVYHADRTAPQMQS